jgi:hypothetical protein
LQADQKLIMGLRGQRTNELDEDAMVAKVIERLKLSGLDAGSRRKSG